MERLELVREIGIQISLFDGEAVNGVPNAVDIMPGALSLVSMEVEPGNLSVLRILTPGERDLVTVQVFFGSDVEDEIELFFRGIMIEDGFNCHAFP